jgi:hypothetical protein
MLPFLAFEHRDPQVLYPSRARLQFTAGMAIAREILRICAATVIALPINFSRLLAHLPQHPFLSSSLDGDFGF